MANSGLGGVLGVAKTGITGRLPVTARKTPPGGWTNVQAFLTAGTFEFIVPEQVWQIALHVNGGGGNSSNQANGAGSGLAYGVLDVVPGQVIRNIVVGGVAGTSSIAGYLSATGGTSASGATSGTAGNGIIQNAALREKFTASGSGGSPGLRPQTPTFTKRGLVALINGELSGYQTPLSVTIAGGASGVNGDDGQPGQSASATAGGAPAYGGNGGTGAPGGTGSNGTTPSSGIGGAGGILGMGGGASGSGGNGGNGAAGGVGQSSGGSGGVGIILIGWTPGY